MEGLWRQIQRHEVRPTGYAVEASQIEVFLSVIGYEVIIKIMYSNGDCLITSSAKTKLDVC